MHNSCCQVYCQIYCIMISFSWHFSVYIFWCCVFECSTGLFPIFFLFLFFLLSFRFCRFLSNVHVSGYPSQVYCGEISSNLCEIKATSNEQFRQTRTHTCTFMCAPMMMMGSTKTDANEREKRPASEGGGEIKRKREREREREAKKEREKRKIRFWCLSIHLKHNKNLNKSRWHPGVVNETEKSGYYVYRPAMKWLILNGKRL